MAPHGMNKVSHAGVTTWLACLALAATFVVYWPALQGGFVFDDANWTTDLVRWFQNPAGLWAIWVHPTVLQQYYPLTATSFWLDYQLWEFWTLPYHLENVLLHILAAVLFWRALFRLQVPGAWLAASLFALHPVMVESAAWITERKNVLSLVLFLGALLAYLRYEEELKVSGSKLKVFYGLALVLFLGALLAKSTACSLPAVILLLAWWRRGRLGWRTDVLPTLPFFALSLGLCAVTAWLEKNHVGAQGPDFALSLAQRCLVAGRAFWFYLGNLFWPAHLCLIYPRWQPDPAVWWQWLYPAGAVGLLLGLWLGRKHFGRGPLAALLFYVGTLFPLLGFLNAYGMRYSFVWDHWVYLPSLGPLALVAALIEGRRKKEEGRSAESEPSPLIPLRKAGGGRRLPGSRAVLAYGFAAVVLPVLGVLTWREAGTYASLETLWQTTLARNPDCWLAENNLGNTLAVQGDLEGALAHYQRALRLKPDYPDAENNLGNALLSQRKWAEAISHYERALQLEPTMPGVDSNIGAALANQGKWEEAVPHFERALQLNPDFVPANVNLGAALAAQGKWDEAIQRYQRALQINPNSAEAHYYWGMALAGQGRRDEATQHFQQALNLAMAQGQAALVQAIRSRLYQPAANSPATP
jgi:tetratricopeptide (TPR) repeat protein